MKNLTLLLTGLRKWSIMIILIAIGVGFRITDHISGSEFVELLTGTAIAFFGSNSIEHGTKALIRWAEGKIARSESSHEQRK